MNARGSTFAKLAAYRDEEHHLGQQEFTCDDTTQNFVAQHPRMRNPQPASYFRRSFLALRKLVYKWGMSQIREAAATVEV